MKNKAAQELGKLSVKQSPETHSKEHMTKLSKLAVKKRTKQNEIRQGDVRLSHVKDLPKNAKPLKDKTLAYGEVTGHSHRFIDTSNIQRYEADNKIYLQVLQPSLLTHEEHNKWQKRFNDTWVADQGYIMPGVYEQISEREYDYIDESAKTVVD